MKKYILALSLVVSVVLLAVPSTPQGVIVIHRTVAAPAASFPTTAVLDDFNRANEGPPPSANWSEITAISSGSSLVVVSNQLESNLGANRTGYWNPSTFGPDSEVRIKIPTKGSGVASTRLYLRLNNPTNAGTVTSYLAIATPSGSIYFYRIDGGPTYVQLGGTISQTVTDGDSFGASIVGSTFTIYYKVGAGAWAALDTRTDATYSGAGYLGVGIDQSVSGDVKLDDFGGGMP